MTISVIVPVYNVAPFLPRCLDSILAQTYKDLEIILIDDGSTDKSSSICDEYAKRDSRVQVIHKENGGVSSARNMGMEIAKGEYLAFVDSDDYIEPKMYEILQKNAVAYDAELVCCGFQQVFTNGKLVQDFTTKAVRRIPQQKIISGYFFDKTVKAFMYAPWNKLIRKTSLKGLRFREDFALGEDILFCFQHLAQVSSAILVDEALYNYCVRDNSAMTSSFSGKRLHYLAAIREIESICQEKFPYAYDLAHLWVFQHTLVTLRQIISNRKQTEYATVLTQEKAYLKQNKKQCLHRLSRLRRLDYYGVQYLPAYIYLLAAIKGK